MLPLRRAVLVAAAVSPALSAAKAVPANVKAFYQSIVKQGQCKNTLATGFHSVARDAGNFGYCGDHLEDFGVLYIQGQNGELANMDIDCDGAPAADPGEAARCGSSTDTQSQTAMRSLFTSYTSTNYRSSSGNDLDDGFDDLGNGLGDLSATVHPYVVLGNSGSKPGWKTFEPREYGVQLGSIVAVVCGNGKMVRNLAVS
ncbi:hypothetical protein CDD83_2416 [Cordyceps sp. RAO-2017]|nr:hypothetical protein CDD83_2416 [Cordyceps sp. RAO-2017]